MVLRLCCLSLVVLVFALPSFGQAQTCDDGFGTVALAESDEHVTQPAQGWRDCHRLGYPSMYSHGLNNWLVAY